MAANLAYFLSCCTRYNTVGCQWGRLREEERICRHQSRITPDGKDKFKSYHFMSQLLHRQKAHDFLEQQIALRKLS